MVSLEEVQAAAARIAPRIHRTPVLTSRLFDSAAGVETRLKCENFQRAGAFKFRGASNFLSRLSSDQLARGVVAFSSGNHAQAVALAASEMGAEATIVMPDDAPAVKVAATESYGAKIIRYNRHRDDREAIGRDAAARTGAALVPPFNHDWIIAGQGTTALEFLEEVRDLDALVICIGGGGLIAGCATAAKAIRPDMRVFGVEPEQANDTFLSFRRGERVEIAPPSTIADGLRAPQPGEITFPIIQRLVDDIFLVTEREIEETMRFLSSRLKIVVEPSGAVAPAAILHRKLPPGIRRAGAIISGGNL